MLSTWLFSHDNNILTALFNHQYCYNLLTRLSNNDNNITNKLVLSLSFSPVSSCFKATVVALSMMNNIVETIVNNIVETIVNNIVR